MTRVAYDKQRVIDIALAEVGYLEKATLEQLDDKTANAGSNNYTKYARDLAAVSYFNGRKQGAAWCAVFVAWCFYKAYGQSAALKMLCQPTSDNCGAGCKYARDYFMDKGRLAKAEPQPGDVIFFYSSDKSSIQHTGLVYKVDDSRVYTVEGNTSSSAGVVANGGSVAKKSYPLTYARLAGYGRPGYGTQTSPETSGTSGAEAPVQDTESGAGANSGAVTTYTVKKGDTLWGIAKKYLGAGNRYTQIMAANGKTSDVIRVGEVLKIPK